MSGLDRLAGLLREVAEERADLSPRERQEALMEVLRRELDSVPLEEIYPKLAELRALFAEGSGESEAGFLWECLGRIPRDGGAPTQPLPAPVVQAASPEGEGAGDLARSVLGDELPSETTLSPELQARTLDLLLFLFETLELQEQEYQDLNLRLRQATMFEGGTGGTVIGLKLMPRLRQVFAKAALETGDRAELETRLKKFGASALLVYTAYHAGIKRSLQKVRKMLMAGLPSHLQKRAARVRQRFPDRVPRENFPGRVLREAAQGVT
jgi:hypothetical protein